MKKLILPFCAVILFATQAPVANANAIEGGKSTTINHYQSTSDYKTKLNNYFKTVKTTPQKLTIKNAEKKTTPIEKEQAAKKEESANVPTNSAASAKTTATTTNNDQTKTDQILSIEEKVVELTNAERAKNGLQALQIDRAVMAAAREKSQDMKSHNYFSHTSPTFGSPFDRLKALGISYKSAGENIAKGQKTPEQVVEAWMNSAGHRANILNKDFTHIGVGYVQDGNIWTQQFIKK
ncbi:CAP domain-containing protein [Solibacillus silvestris]|uniref:CAP domain-containing protein n=1 Tax=Solibacillus silvestris TaxID=76853 RepID=UPI003F803603